MTTDVKATRSIDKSRYIQPSKPATFGQDGWTVVSDEPAVLETESDTHAFLFGIACVIVLIALIAYVAISVFNL